MDGRDAFLTMARDRHYEFSSLRRAQFSTLCMLWELHNQGQDKFVYTCNACKSHVETRWHCSICDVSIINFFFLLYSTFYLSAFLSIRILICVPNATRKRTIHIKWTNSAWTLTTVQPLQTRNRQILKMLENYQYSVAYSHWSMLANVGMLIVVHLLAIR